MNNNDKLFIMFLSFLKKHNVCDVYKELWIKCDLHPSLNCYHDGLSFKKFFEKYYDDPFTYAFPYFYLNGSNFNSLKYFLFFTLDLKWKDIIKSYKFTNGR